MPKYIRTKDNLFKVVAEDWLGNEDEDIENMELDGYWVEPHSKNENYRKYNRNFIRKDKVIKTADTIEKLCDVFMIKDTKGRYAYITNSKPNMLYENCEIYGAIWTDKGLIYVAKMNEKGELCLI